MKQNVDDIKLKEARELLESHGFECCDFNTFIASLGIECIEVIPPINSTICCVRRADKQWAAFELGNMTPIVDFGKYNHMWGFDGGYCLVSVADKDRTTFANRGIIDSRGNEVVKPYTYTNIWKFYGENRPEIIAFTEDRIVEIDRNNPTEVTNKILNVQSNRIKNAFDKLRKPGCKDREYSLEDVIKEQEEASKKIR